MPPRDGLSARLMAMTPVRDHDAFDEAPELISRYVKAVALNMLASLMVVVASFLLGSIWPDGYLSWQALAQTADRWEESAGRLALPVLGIVVGLLLPLYLAPLGSRDLEEKASTDEESLTASDHEILAIQDVRENLILMLATAGGGASWWMLPAALKNPLFSLLVFMLAMVFASLATIREATSGRASMHLLRSHRSHRGLTRLLQSLGVTENTDRNLLEADLVRARRRERWFIFTLVALPPLALWLAGDSLSFGTLTLDSVVISIIVVPYLIWRWTGTIRTRIRRAKMDGARGGGLEPAPLVGWLRNRLRFAATRKPTPGDHRSGFLISSALTVLVDIIVLAVVYSLTHAAAESQTPAVIVVGTVALALVVLLAVLPRHSPTHRLLVIDAALRARRRTVAGG